MEMKFYLENGQVLDFDKDHIEKVDVDILVKSISREKRFYNQMDFSVLEHSLTCFYASQLLFAGNELLIAHALCHDLHEALIRDVPRMVKTKDFKELEESIMSKLHEALRLRKLSKEDQQYLKLVDDAVAVVEAYNYGNPALVEAILKAFKKEFGSWPEYESALLCSAKAFDMVESLDMYVLYNTGTDEKPEYTTELNPEIYEVFREVLRVF